ncbi:MAG: SUMF1/EgtB/PvdO family nonheme iron enzyme, partial [Aquificales bacterium]|nr:SUMF1/EgtB/PvdO family nonheme iron enzyme [Aquificales bacterium]
ASDLLAELLSGDDARIREAAARLEAEETEQEGQLESAQQQMVQTLQNPAQPTRVRVSAGSALARLGDPRFRADTWYLPADPLLGFVEIPAGPFLMGSNEKDAKADKNELPQHTLELSAYYMARYPVTTAQFRAFVEASGYKPEDEDSLRGPDNHPAIWVRWREAIKYCNWLTEQLRQRAETPEPLRGLLRGDNGKRWRVILPSEAEWEKAARGTERLIYPWNGDFDADKANTKETGIGTTSAVGCFPGGASPHGCLDMSGNVWEWTRSLWGEKSNQPDFNYPYQADDGRENLKASDSTWRIIRGGSYLKNANLARCAFRLRLNLLNLDGDRGFRVALSTLFTSDL